MGQAYLSCNLAWRFLVYRKSSPEGFEENIFSLCSLVELFNLIFVRSVQSASLYPKVVTASLVAWQSKTSSFELFCGLSTCALCPKAVFAGFMTVFDFDIYLVVICFTDSGDATGLPPLLHFFALCTHFTTWHSLLAAPCAATRWSTVWATMRRILFHSAV